MCRFDSGKILQVCEVILVLLSSSFVTQVALKGSRTTLTPHDLPQIIRKNLPHRISTFTPWCGFRLHWASADENYNTDPVIKIKMLCQLAVFDPPAIMERTWESCDKDTS